MTVSSFTTNQTYQNCQTATEDVQKKICCSYPTSLAEVTWKECKSLLASFRSLISNSFKFKLTQISSLFKHSATLSRKLVKNLNKTLFKSKTPTVKLQYAWRSR